MIAVAQAETCDAALKNPRVWTPPIHWDEGAAAPAYHRVPQVCWWTSTNEGVYRWEPFTCRYPALSAKDIQACMTRLGINHVMSAPARARARARARVVTGAQAGGRQSHSHHVLLHRQPLQRRSVQRHDVLANQL